MINSTYAAQLVAASYDPIPPDVFDTIYRNQAITVCTKTVGDTLYIVLPGTEKERDVIIDFESQFNLHQHPILGLIVESFYEGVDDAFAFLKPLIAKVQQVAFAAHSAGCARALDLAGLVIYEQKSIACIDIFEPPLNSDQYLVDFVRDNTLRFRAFCNGSKLEGDPVPYLPWHKKLVQHTLIDINTKPPAPWGLERIHRHLMATVLEGVTHWETQLDNHRLSEH